MASANYPWFVALELFSAVSTNGGELSAQRCCFGDKDEHPVDDTESWPILFAIPGCLLSDTPTAGLVKNGCDPGLFLGHGVIIGMGQKARFRSLAKS